MCGNDVCVCDKIDWMENGLSGCGKWKVESGGWRGSGSHICHNRIFTCC